MSDERLSQKQRTLVLCALLFVLTLCALYKAHGAIWPFSARTATNHFASLGSPSTLPAEAGVPAMPMPAMNPTVTGRTNSLTLPTNAIWFHLSWMPSPGTNIAGYKIYWGIASRTYTNSFSTGTNLQCFLTNLVIGVRYFIAATALNLPGLESDYSGEVSAIAGLKEYVFHWERETSVAGPFISLLDITNQYWITNRPVMDPMTAFYRIRLERTQ